MLGCERRSLSNVGRPERYHNLALWPNWIRHRSTDPEIAGSSPARVEIFEFLEILYYLYIIMFVSLIATQTSLYCLSSHKSRVVHLLPFVQELLIFHENDIFSVVEEDNEFILMC